MRLARIALFCAVLVPYVAGAEAPKKATAKVVADRIAAVVNDQVILVSEVDQRMLPLRAQAQQITDPNERDRRLAKLAVEMLDEMVNDELILQAGQAAKLSVDESEIDSAIDYIKTQNKMNAQQLEEAMKAQGVTRQTIKNDLLRQRTVNEMVGRKVSVTDDDLRARYAELQRRSSGVAAVNISNIVFALPEHATQQQQDAAKARAQKAIERVKAGETFAAVATDTTDDESTKSGGGMLGWVEPTSLDPIWESVVMGMDKGDVRGPISGPKGLYVFYANEIKRNELAPFDKMKEQLASELRRTQLAKLSRTWVEELRKKAYIEIKLQ